MTLYRPVDVTAALEVRPAPSGDGGTRPLMRLKLRDQVEDLNREECEQLRDVDDEALS